METFYHLAGSLSKKAVWRYGKVRTVLACDFRDLYPKHEYAYLRGVYPGVVDLIHDEIPLQQRKKNYLSELTRNDKLIIVGHASSRGLIAMNEMALVALLRRAGLREIGVIKFHACYTGYDIWLYHVREQLYRHGIYFSYLCGPRGRYVYHHFPFRHAKEGYRIVRGNISREFYSTRYISENVDG